MTTLQIVGLVIGAVIFAAAFYMLGWRAGHLSSVDYAVRLFVLGAPDVDLSDAVGKYTRDTIASNGKRVESVQEETYRLIEEMRRNGLK